MGDKCAFNYAGVEHCCPPMHSCGLMMRRRHRNESAISIQIMNEWTIWSRFFCFVSSKHPTCEAFDVVHFCVLMARSDDDEIIACCYWWCLFGDDFDDDALSDRNKHQLSASSSWWWCWCWQIDRWTLATWCSTSGMSGRACHVFAQFATTAFLKLRN